MSFTLSSVRKLQHTYESLGRDRRIIDQLSTHDKAEIQRIFAIEKQLKQGRPVMNIWGRSKNPPRLA